MREYKKILKIAAMLLTLAVLGTVACFGDMRQSYASDIQTIDLSVYLNFYDESQANPDDIIAMVSSPAIGVLEGDVIRAKVNPSPAFYEFNWYENGKWPRVYLNYSSLNTEKDITDVCSYDARSGIMTIPAEYKEEAITVKSVMGDESYAYVNLVDDEFKYPLVDDASMYEHLRLTKEDLEASDQELLRSWKDYETIIEPDAWKNNTTPWRAPVNDTFGRSFSPDRYYVGQVIQCRGVYVTILNQTKFRQTNLNDFRYYHSTGSSAVYQGFALSLVCEDPVFHNVGRSCSGTNTETWNYKDLTTGQISTQSAAFQTKNWLFGTCVQQAQNWGSGNPYGNDVKIMITHKASDGTLTCYVKVWTPSNAQNVGSYFRIKPTTQPPDYRTTGYRARDAYAPKFDLQIEKTDAKTGNTVKDASFDVYMDGKKMASVTTDADGKAAYHWRGSAQYTDYYSASKKYVTNYSSLSDADKNKINSDANLFASLDAAYTAARNEVTAKTNEALQVLKSRKHTWKVVETKAPDGYQFDPEHPPTWEQTLEQSVTAVEVDFTNVPDQRGELSLQKHSGEESLISDNDCYSLEDAVYGVYSSAENADSDTKRLTTLTTDPNGTSNVVTLSAGDYYVKEITASKGHLFCDGSLDDADKQGIHKVTVEAKKHTVLSCTEPVATDALSLQLHKLDLETGEAAPQGIASLAGAIFELDYYANTHGDISKNPLKKWFFKTDENGCFNCNTESCLVSGFTKNDGTALISDSLYKDDASGKIIYPLGTYILKEVSPPMYYQNAGILLFQTLSGLKKSTDVTNGLKFLLKQEKNGGSVHLYGGAEEISEPLDIAHLDIYAWDKPQKGSITLYKKSADDTKKPLPGVTFQMFGMETGDAYTAVTDENGKILWDDLVPQNYKITEISTVDGYSLLKEEIEVRLPTEMTLDEIQKNGADLSKAVFDETAGTYGFYDVTLSIDNDVAFQLPHTGSSVWDAFVFLVTALGLGAVGFCILFRKKTDKEKWCWE